MSETRRAPELARAIEVAGGVNALARALGISSASVADWKQVPAGRVRAVAEITKLSKHALRPDLYDAPPVALRQPSAPSVAA